MAAIGDEAPIVDYEVNSPVWQNTSLGMYELTNEIDMFTS